MCACSRRCSVGVQHGAAWSHDKSKHVMFCHISEVEFTASHSHLFISTIPHSHSVSGPLRAPFRTTSGLDSFCGICRQPMWGSVYGIFIRHSRILNLRIISLFFKHLLLQWPFSPFLSIYCHKEPLMQVPFLDTKGIVPEDMLEWDQKRYLLDFLAIEHGNFLETNVAQYWGLSSRLSEIPHSSVQERATTIAAFYAKNAEKPHSYSHVPVQCAPAVKTATQPTSRVVNTFLRFSMPAAIVAAHSGSFSSSNGSLLGQFPGHFAVSGQVQENKGGALLQHLQHTPYNVQMPCNISSSSCTAISVDYAENCSLNCLNAAASAPPALHLTPTPHTSLFVSSQASSGLTQSHHPLHPSHGATFKENSTLPAASVYSAENRTLSADFCTNVDQQARQVDPTFQAPTHTSNALLNSPTQQSPEVIVPLCKVVKNTTSGIPETHIQQNNPIIFTQQNSLLSTGFTALTPLCTVSENVQSIPSVPTCSVAVGAHSSMTDSEQHNTLPFTSQNIPPASLPICHISPYHSSSLQAQGSILHLLQPNTPPSSSQTSHPGILTSPQLNSPIPTTSFASLLKNAEQSTPTILAPIHSPYIERYNQQQHSSHDPSTVNARKNKQHLVPILSTKPSVSASNPTTVARNNQKSQLQPITTATDSLADQNGVVTGVESKDSMPSNTVMALNEVFGAHSPPLITFNLYWDGDGDGENWDFFEESDDDIAATIAHDDDQFHAATPSNKRRSD
ncbi:hypothetical protein LguiA_012895 [Lonicera macranthoides]